MKSQYLSRAFGAPVVLSYSHATVARVRDILVDNENGRIVAFKLGKGLIVLPQDVLAWKSYILIPDESHIVPMDEIVRVQELLNRHIGLFGKRVVTEQGEYIGHVYDLEFYTETFTLKNLHTAKIFFIFKFQPRIIPSKHIVMVKKRVIVIKEPLQKKRVKQPVAKRSFSPAV